MTERLRSGRTTHPQARWDLEFQQGRMGQHPVLVVLDPLKLSKDPVILSAGAVNILRLLDGRHSAQEIQLELARQQGGLLIPLREIEEVIEELERSFLLEGEVVQRRRQEEQEEFALLSRRPPFHLGSAYPQDAGELRRWLEQTLAAAPSAPLPVDRLAAVVAPHIDLRIGQELYGMAYGALQGVQPKRIILLGTGHTIQEGLFSLTSKSYETPLGGLPTDEQAVERLRQAGGSILSPNDWPHRQEHSLEFQVVFLRYLLQKEVPLVPILCGSFYDLLDEISRPAEHPEIQCFLEALRALLTEDTLLIAAVDFSHVGLKFGDPLPAASLVAEAQQHDQTLLDALCDGDLAAFWQESRRVHDRYHVCGFSSLALLLELLPSARGVLLKHTFWHEAETHSAVSYASLLFPRP